MIEHYVLLIAAMFINVNDLTYSRTVYFKDGAGPTLWREPYQISKPVSSASSAASKKDVNETIVP